MQSDLDTWKKLYQYQKKQHEQLGSLPQAEVPASAAAFPENPPPAYKDVFHKHVTTIQSPEIYQHYAKNPAFKKVFNSVCKSIGVPAQSRMLN